MRLIRWWKSHRHGVAVDKLHKDIKTKQLHEAEKHTENLVLRSQAVKREMELRRERDPWGQTVAEIARKER